MNGDHLRKRRKELNMTLEQVGDIVGVGKSTVRKWETGDIENMRRDKIALLAKALRTTPLFVMGIDEKQEQPKQLVVTGDLRRLVEKYNALDDMGKHTVKTVLNVEYDRVKRSRFEVVAAHNDDQSPEQLDLMREDLDELDKL